MKPTASVHLLLMFWFMFHFLHFKAHQKLAHMSVSGCDRNYLSSCQTGLNFFRHKFMLVTSIPRERVMGTQRQILTELKHIILPHCLFVTPSQKYKLQYILL